MAEQHPELVVAFLKGMIKVGRWCNEHKHAAAAILDKATFYLDVEDTYRSIQNVDFVPSLSPQNLAADRGRQGLHAEPRLHQERLRRAEVGRARVPGDRRRKELIEEQWKKVTAAKLPEADCASARITQENRLWLSLELTWDRSPPRS